VVKGVEAEPFAGFRQPQGGHRVLGARL
jgi:hypothetical protein